LESAGYTEGMAKASDEKELRYSSLEDEKFNSQRT